MNRTVLPFTTEEQRVHAQGGHMMEPVIVRSWSQGNSDTTVRGIPEFSTAGVYIREAYTLRGENLLGPVLRPWSIVRSVERV